jgi:hypothetical protein
MLRGRLTELVFYQDVTAQVRVFQYLPALFTGEDPDPKSIRQLDLLQRFFLSGQLDRAEEYIDDLVAAKFVEPIAGCLGIHLLLRSKQLDRVEIATSNLLRLCPDLSDSHVLRASYDLAQGRETEAERGFRRALDCGLPIVAPNVDRLAEGIRRFAINAPLGALLDTVRRHRVGVLWTAWIPPEAVAEPTPGTAG